MPVGARIMRTTLRTSSDEATSTAQASATSATTRARPIRRPRMPVDERVPSLSASAADAPAETSAGTSPNSSVVIATTPSEKASSGTSMVTCSSRGTRAGSMAIAPFSSSTAPSCTGRRTGRREQQALDEHLPHQPQPRRPERGSHRHLARPGRGARQQQTGDVQAGGDQHERHRPEQHVERGPVVAEHVVEQRHRRRQPVAIGRHVLLTEAGADRRQFSRGLLVADPRLQPGDRFHEMRAAAVLGEVPRQSQPQIDVVGKIERGWHDADDRVLGVVDLDRTSEDAGVGVVA